jgi:hypothetical protein
MQNNNTIEEKRRKNLIDNQKFLENLKLINVFSFFSSKIFFGYICIFRYVMSLNRQLHERN